MQGWQWLTQPARADDGRFVVRVVLKAWVLFVAFNVLFAVLRPIEALGRVSLYHGLVEGRARLPYGEDARAYNLSLDSLTAMFSSHAVASPKTDDTYRVILIGDSSVWGVLLRPEETLSAILTAQGAMRDSRQVVVYNLGYPTMSLTKDLLLLEEALNYAPDHIVWLTTLQSFPRHQQVASPLVARNPERLGALVGIYGVDVPLKEDEQVAWWDATLIGQRRALADWWRLQMFGLAWQTTGIDQVYGDYTLRSNDFEADIGWQAGGLDAPTSLDEALLAFDVLEAGHLLVRERLGEHVRVTLVNEPIFIADGANSDLRYNLWYPRWAYDAYRALYADMAQEQGWHYVDVWNAIAPEHFTDSPVHLTPQGSEALAGLLMEAIVSSP